MTEYNHDAHDTFSACGIDPKSLAKIAQWTLEEAVKPHSKRSHLVEAIEAKLGVGNVEFNRAISFFAMAKIMSDLEEMNKPAKALLSEAFSDPDIEAQLRSMMQREAPELMPMLDAVKKEIESDKADSPR